MIEFVKGYVQYIDPQSIVVDVLGVGYQIYCANPYVYKVDVEKETIVYTYHYVREDQMKLFGFSSRDERATRFKS